MNNRDGASIAAKVRVAAYGPSFARVFGGALDDPEATLNAVGRALEAFLTSDEMAPFSSKFDGYVRRTETLSSVELSGLALFKDPAKGGCASCHIVDDAGRDPATSLFSDFGYDALGVPRNDRVPGTRKPDLGLCERTDKATPSDNPMYCVSFRTPSLRNVAVRRSYMHNGAFTSLRDVVAFYATRATNPGRWYKSGVKFDDVPAQYRSHVNTASPPYNRREGDRPALSDQEIDAIVAFLKTLTDARYAQRRASR
jgi:cytochrome c peroxidase